MRIVCFTRYWSYSTINALSRQFNGIIFCIFEHFIFVFESQKQIKNNDEYEYDQYEYGTAYQ